MDISSAAPAPTQSSRTDQILEQALDAVVSIDENNCITFFNAAAERLWKYRRDEVMGQNVKMLVPRMHQSQHDGYVDRNRQTGQDRIVGTSRTVEIHQKGGTMVWGLLSLSRVKLEHETHYTAFVRDITEDMERRQATQAAMQEVVKSSDEIDKITASINGIGLQTQLLAINAAIEAAHAGAAGKGFAVVAQEVNNLSVRSNQAAEQISELVASTKSKIDQLAELLGRT